jgi:uncharacterized protein (TIGR00251 family)
MIVVQERAEGCILPVRAQPGSKKAGVVGEHGGALKIAVTSPPQDGRANKALSSAIRDLFNLRASEVELLSGASSRDKRFLLRGMKKQQLEPLLATLLSRPRHS